MELWRKEETVKSLEQILVEIRTYEAATDNLLDNARLASGSTTLSKRCYKCDNLLVTSPRTVCLGPKQQEGPGNKPTPSAGSAGDQEGVG